MKKTVIITGASGNLGKACVETFLNKGYKIIATVSPGKSLEYDVEGDITTEEVDLTNEDSVNNFIKSQTAQNNIDCALLLVGGFAMGNIEKTDASLLHKMLDLNFFTTYHCARPLFLKMQSQQNGGRIILIGSRPAQKAKEGKNALAYALSKSLVFNLADLLNAESNSKKVVTHVVVPGTIDTEANRNAMPDANFDDWVSPESIAENIAWLCSEHASSVRHGVVNLYGNLKD